jgi:hypothetical protein
LRWLEGRVRCRRSMGFSASASVMAITGKRIQS